MPPFPRLSELNKAASVTPSTTGPQRDHPLAIKAREFARELWDLGLPPTSSIPCQLEAEPRHDPPCCCTPPRSCPAPGESACRAARSSSWRRQSRALHICRSPSVCRAGTWWRLGRKAGRRGGGLGHETGGEPGLGQRVREEAGPGRAGTA